MQKPKIIIIPGNGGTDIIKDNWYSWLKNKLTNKGYVVIAENMPDPILAHKDIWLDHIKNVFKTDENTIIIGHSSGGVAGLRYLENNKLKGLIALGVNYTDLGYPEEAESGYYNTPWQWNDINANTDWIIQLCSQDDPYIPISEPRFIHEQTNSEYHEYRNKGHFSTSTCQELFDILMNKLTSS